VENFWKISTEETACFTELRFFYTVDGAVTFETNGRFTRIELPQWSVKISSVIFIFTLHAYDKKCSHFAAPFACS